MKKLLCSICKKDARRKYNGRRLKEAGLDMAGDKREPRIILCEDCVDRINSHYDY